MVLEDIDESGSDGFLDSPPGSDNDPYSSSESATAIYHIDAAAFPQPMPVFGRLFGYYPLLERQLHLRFKIAGRLLNRPPTEEEANALTYWTAKQLSLMSYGGPIGYAGGLWRAYASRSTLRFPFYAPKFEHFGSVWPSSSTPVLTGPMALRAWHGTRAAAYCFVGYYLGSILATSYSLSVVTVGEHKDPRLKDYTQAVDREARAIRGQSPSTRSKPVGSTRHPTMPGPEQHPTPQPNRAENSPDTLQSEPQLWSFNADYDDASPTRGKESQDLKTTGGSAWERLRQQGSSQAAGNRDSSWPSGRGGQQSTSRQGAWPQNRSPSRHEHDGQGDQGNSTTEDGFAFSKSEEERQLAKEEAQKDFDARIEQERRGGDFNTGTGHPKRW